MKKIITLFAIIITLTVSSFAGGKAVSPAQSEVAPIPEIITPIPLYIGLGVIGSFIDRDPCPCKPHGKDLKDTEYGMVARVGFDYNQYIGIEGRYLKTFGTNVFSKVEHYGVYLKPQYHISDKTNVYGLLGYGKTNIYYTNGILNCIVKKKSFSYGLGFEYDLSSDKSEGEYRRKFDGEGNQEKGWGLWVDFQHLLNNEHKYHSNSNILSIGITYDF